MPYDFPVSCRKSFQTQQPMDLELSTVLCEIAACREEFGPALPFKVFQSLIFALKHRACVQRATGRVIRSSWSVESREMLDEWPDQVRVLSGWSDQVSSACRAPTEREIRV